MSPSEAHHVQWPTERFYFAIVNAPSKRLGRRARDQLLYSAEPQLPVSLESLSAVVVTNSDGMVIVCAVAREDLKALSDRTVMLSPTALPGCIGDQVVRQQFNVLTGPFESRRVRRLRRSGSLVLILAMCLLGVLVVVGLNRRTYAIRAAVAAHTVAIHAVAQHVVDPEVAAASSQRIFLQLTAELRRLRQTRTSAVVDPELFDAPETLAAVLGQWPSELQVQTQSIVVTRTQILIRAELPASSDVQRFADSLAALPGWQLNQPRINTTQDGASSTLTLVPLEVVP